MMVNKDTLVNSSMRLLDRGYNITPNTVKINVKNTLEHEVAKFIKCYELIKEGNKIVTEGIFLKGKGRCDILVLNRMQVIEILHSESEKEVLSKRDKYPDEVDFIYFKSKEVIDESGIKNS